MPRTSASASSPVDTSARRCTSPGILASASGRPVSTSEARRASRASPSTKATRVDVSRTDVHAASHRSSVVGSEDAADVDALATTWVPRCARVDAYRAATGSARVVSEHPRRRDDPIDRAGGDTTTAVAATAMPAVMRAWATRK